MRHKEHGNDDAKAAAQADRNQQAIADRRFVVGDLTPEQEDTLERYYGVPGPMQDRHQAAGPRADGLDWMKVGTKEAYDREAQ